SKSPQARLHALWSLHGLNALTDPVIARALGDETPGVREHAVRLAESRLVGQAMPDGSKSQAQPDLLKQLLALANAPAPRVRCQVAFTLGETKDQRAAATLAELARRH